MAGADDTPAGSSKKTAPAKLSAQGMQLLPLLVKFFKNMGTLLAVWGTGYFGFSTAWVMIGLFVYLANEEYKKVKDAKRSYARDAAVDEKKAILARVEELPSWVFFPDVEKAEWLNKMIKQMWPFVGNYTRNLLKTSVEPKVQSSLPKSLTPFRFEKIDLGDIPPRIGGVKVYTDNVKRDEIIMDLEIFVMSDSDITVTVRGISAGIKQLTIHGTLRIQFRPLLRTMPIIGGMNIFFLNPPSVDFDLTNTANLLDLPVLSNTLRTVVEDQIAFYMVLPNKIPISMSDKVSIASLKYPTPQGVLRLHVVAGKDLVAADMGFLGRGKSDPYCKLMLGASTFKTKVVKENCNPVWNQYFEAVVEEKHGQIVDVTCYDQDATGDDDELGSTSLDIHTIAEQGSIDTWLPLEGVKSGMIHVRALWLHLSKDPDDLDRSMKKNADMRPQTGNEDHLSSAVLLVTLDSAKDLPRSKKSLSEPSPMCRVTVANTTRESGAQQNTTNPLWEHNFEFLLHNPRIQELDLEVVDSRKNGRALGRFMYPIRSLLTARDMTVHGPFALNDSNPNATVTLRLCLRILTSEMPAEWALDSGEQPDALETDVDSGYDNQSPSQPASPTAPTQPASPAAAQPASQPISQPINQSGTQPVSKPATQAPETIRADVPPRSPTLPSEQIIPVKADTVQTGTPGTEVRHRGQTASTDTEPSGLGKLRVTVRYSPQRNKLILVCHNCINLLPAKGDSDNSADPYLKIYILPERSNSSKRKTNAVQNNLNPIFDETFEWSMTLSEAQSKTLEIQVRNEVGMFSKTRSQMGVVHIDLSHRDLTKSFTDWFPLEESEEK